MGISLKTDQEILKGLAARVRRIRLQQNLTQAQVSARSLVPLPTYKVFEKEGRLSLVQFVSVANVLGFKDQLDEIIQPPPAENLDDFIRVKKTRQRARA
jgi:transcriptional regulator with XRE-family HTH domain